MDMTTIRLSDCVSFADNPFRVQDDTAMEMLTESIKESGILTFALYQCILYYHIFI